MATACGQELLHGLVEALHLAAGLGMVGPGVLRLDAQGEQLLFGRPGHLMVALVLKMSPLSVSNEAGYPQVSAAWWRTRTTSVAFTTAIALEATQSLEWSSIMLRTS